MDFLRRIGFQDLRNSCLLRYVSVLTPYCQKMGHLWLYICTCKEVCTVSIHPNAESARVMSKERVHLLWLNKDGALKTAKRAIKDN